MNSEDYFAIAPGIFQARGERILLGKDDMDMVVGTLSESPHGRSRICSHTSDIEPLHEMFIVLERYSYIRPHRHIGRSESFLLIEGVADVVFFNEDGSLDEVVRVERYGSGSPFYYRLNDSVFHTLIVRSKYLIYHECVNGPYDSEATEFASWSPLPDSGAVAEYIAELEKEIKNMEKASE